MALNEVLGLLWPVAWHDLTQVISLQASGSCGPAVSVSGRCPALRARGPRRLPLTSVAGSERGKERTDSHYGVQTIWQGRGSAGAVSGARTWPVRPATAPSAPAAPGKPYRMLYRMAYDVVWSYRIKKSTS